jgi:hypothetical protein
MTEQFDVFLCHNSEDKPQVRKIAEQLQQYDLKPWLDIWEFSPGRSWQRLLEKQIEQISSVAVFVGKNGFGPWQQQELYAFLSVFVGRDCPVIPVLLPNAPTKPELPAFLRGLTWVDFRVSDPDPMYQLRWGITGKKPDQQTCPKYNLKPQMLTPQAIQGIQFVFNVSFFFFRIELGTKTHGFRYFWVFLGNAVKAYCDWVVNFRTSLTN